MPRTYIAESVAPRIRVIFFPWPAISPDRIGTIGNTQGVSERSNPNPRKLPMMSQKLPVFMNRAIFASSAGSLVKVPGDCNDVEPFADKPPGSAVENGTYVTGN